MLIALSKSPSGDPLTEAQRAEVELFMARVLDRADTDDDRATLRSIFEAIATATMPAAWHALGTGDEAALDGYDVERLKTESLRIAGELPELFRGVVSSRLRGEGPELTERPVIRPWSPTETSFPAFRRGRRR